MCRVSQAIAVSLNSENVPLPQHMQTLVGPENQLWFTHLSQSSVAAVRQGWLNTEADNTKVTTLGVLEAMQREGVQLSSVCLLDPKAEKALAPEDGDGRFQWFLFGVSPGL